MINRISYVTLVIFFSLLCSSTLIKEGSAYEGMIYTLSIDKTEIKDSDKIITITADINIDESYYLQSSDPILSDNETRFEFDEDESVFKNLNQMKEPTPKIEYVESLSMDVGKHYNNVQMTQEIIPKDNISPGEYDLEGWFTYQICDPLKCIPHWDEFTIKIIVLDDIKAPIVDSDDSLWGKISAMMGSFFVAFLAGLIAIITPCVFPMIPMTVAFFAKGSKRGTKESIKTGLIFGLSIIMIFMIIGLLFSFVFGTADLANQLATSASANIIFALIFLVFAISFFGYFEIQIPTKILNRINKKADGGGLIGIFFMALTLVLVSFSCTAPIVGTVMIDAISGDVLKPIIMMLGFSMAFAIPFSLFAIFPSWLESLPQSGGWLNSVKIVLGFLELALCIKFLSMPDQAYHWGILSRETFLIIWILIFGAMGLYLIGIIKFKSDSSYQVSFGAVRIFTIIATFGFCIYMGLGLFGGNVSALAGIIPPHTPPNPTVGEYGEIVKYSDRLHLPHGLRGYFDYEQAKEVALDLEKPLFLDFTGHACFNCRRMEDNVWIDSTVYKMLDTEYIIVALYVDDRTPLPENSKYKTLGLKNFYFQKDKFNSIAQPFYVLLDPTDSTMTPLVNPKAYDTNIRKFIEFLKEGRKKYDDS